jgi:hypothetical protein
VGLNSFWNKNFIRILKRNIVCFVPYSREMLESYHNGNLKKVTSLFCVSLFAEKDELGLLLLPSILPT